MSQPLIIVGTDTGCGKTIVTGLLAHYLSSSNKCRVSTQKLIQTGNTTDNDLATHDHYAPNMTDLPLSLRCPYSFPDPVSPHFAAEIQSQTINIDRITTAFYALSKQVDYLLCETSGGIMVPYSKNTTQLDILIQLNVPVIVVAANQLGSLNHTLLTVNRLLSEKLPVCGVILSQPYSNIDADLLANNESTLRHWLPVPVLGSLPYRTKTDLLHSEFKPIAKQLIQIL
tara:strand:- start:215 stop:898 length:684 start_codon:yes stop_codon:yes gene_type:complete